MGHDVTCSPFYNKVIDHLLGYVASIKQSSDGSQALLMSPGELLPVATCQSVEASLATCYLETKHFALPKQCLFQSDVLRL